MRAPTWMSLYYQTTWVIPLLNAFINDFPSNRYHQHSSTLSKLQLEILPKTYAHYKKNQKETVQNSFNAAHLSILFSARIVTSSLVYVFSGVLREGVSPRNVVGWDVGSSDALRFF